MADLGHVPELLRRDVHPAELLLPDGTLLAGVRVFVTDRRLIAYGTTPDGHLIKRAECPLEQPCSVPASRGTLGAGRLEARLEEGGTAWVNRGGGCGCGSPLKALAAPVPWTTDRRA